MTGSQSRQRLERLTAEHLREILHYDDLTGDWTWLKTMGCRAKAGAAAGFRHHHGYRMIGVYGEGYTASRLAWLYMRGEWPPKDIEIDHKDMDRTNDRWDNLRLATKAQQAANRRMHPFNTSGRKGVSFHKLTGKWQAAMTVHGRHLHLGLYGSVAEAAEVYADAFRKRFGEYARL